MCSIDELLISCQFHACSLLIPLSAISVRAVMASKSLALMLASSQLSAAICFDANGNENAHFFPCNPSDDISVCCSDTDYCLDNGLCLDAGGDNMFNVQGCTSRNWDSPCKQYCPDMVFLNYYQDLTLCKTNDRTSGEYCCGQNASCCSHTSSLYFTIPLFQSVFRAGGTSSPTQTPTASVASASKLPSSSISSSNSPSASSSSSSSSPPNNTGTRSNDGLKIGLGVGLGVGLGLVAAAIAFLAWEVRKRNTSYDHGQQTNEVPMTRPSGIFPIGRTHKQGQRAAQELPSTPIQAELPTNLQHSL
ncbi:hypothetical protein GGR57DRAFT_452610, partial [Xylariaceae sp. FL1272]